MRSEKKIKFKSPDWTKSEVTYVRNNYERETLMRLIELHPEIFLNEDIYIDEELTSLWKEKYREKRLNKLLNK